MANNMIALLAKPPEFESAVDRESKGLQLEALRDASKLRQQGMADELAVRDVYKNNADPAARIEALYRVNPKAALAAEKAQSDLAKEAAETTDKTSSSKARDVESNIKKMTQAGQAMAYVMKNPTPEVATQVLDSLERNGIYSSEAVAHYKDLILKDPSQVKVLAEQGYAQALSVKDHLATQGTRNLGGVLQNTATDPITGKVTVTDSNTLTQSPDQLADTETARRGQNMQQSQHNARLAFDKSKESAVDGVEGNFTDAAIDAAAARYNMDGTLPPMGMGKAGALGRSRILNRAAEVSGTDGTSPEDQRIAQIGNKANAAALSKLQQQQTMVGAFERNFVKNADIVEEYSKKVDRTGVPILNKWINAGKRNVGGDPELAAFDVAVKAVSNEYAKIISGSMGNTATAQGEIAKVSALLAAAQTPAQVTSVVNLMRRETQNRMHGFDEEKDVLRKSMNVRKPKTSGAPNTNAQGWTLHTDANGNKAYVSPDGKQFQEVK